MQNDTYYILALFKRDDGERLLLGSGYYAFANTQKHFNPNTFSNDVVELQGTDGQLLAGQVRRSTSQSFDGFVGNGTTSRSMVEQKRREFFLFFRKQHHYTVVYIMPDGTTIKRERGYITDAPAVQELYQVQPKYHVALAFEDVNYYSYAEDAQGNEIYSFSATLALANIEDGGLIWDANGAVSDNTGLKDIQINGDTFQQSYEGKNIFNYTTLAEGTYNGVTANYDSQNQAIVLNGTCTTDNTVIPFNITPFSVSGNQTISYEVVDGTISNATTNTRVILFQAGYASSINVQLAQTNGSASFTRSGEYTIARIRADNGVEFKNYKIRVQLELSATASSFEPYVGGQPSPSPDYPQPIQTVTGTQTISINGTDYPLDLGDIELCGLGDDGNGNPLYKDRIYRDGEDWKVHRANGYYALTDSVSITPVIDTSQPNTTRFQFTNILAEPSSTSGRTSLKCSHFKYANMWNTDVVGIQLANYSQESSNTRFWFRIPKTIATTFNQLKAWLANNTVELYYPLATATDTVITNQALIDQLEAIAEAMASDGKPTTITATGQNLPAIITGELNGTGGYIFAPSTGGGPVTVTVNGVDDANPVWHVIGPATNPTLTNSTTGEALVWNGTVPSGQELIIDMGAQTATMEGANVFEFVSGSWVTLAPGTNRISYTAANTTTPSTVYWNEVVG